MSEVFLSCVVGSKHSYEQKMGDPGWDSIPAVPDDIAKQKTSMWIVVRNKTMFKLTPVHPPHWDGAAYQNGPVELEPYTTKGIGIKDDSMFGTFGGICYHAALDASNVYKFSVGFGNPLVGPVLGYVEESEDPKGACDRRRIADSAVESLTPYVARDKNGAEVVWKFHLYFTPGKTGSNKTQVLTISQVMTELADK
ncbi:uncharacterized protein DSM5745_07945 [Aspergillus mulundensis]|uniref:Uncharacterized protein n=1 Tax=Aspergillus mulundensis TaxID=1810919 RepID=A0A3D8RFE6_9EURO|nr:hypothetical protein DSM5745_07945 [Aspergillus mulundensis]RDW72773.1 hypothetical protein DSM5745_07945 [Aspergillus mulundensis]